MQSVMRSYSLAWLEIVSDTTYHKRCSLKCCLTHVLKFRFSNTKGTKTVSWKLIVLFLSFQQIFILNLINELNACAWWNQCQQNIPSGFIQQYRSSLAPIVHLRGPKDTEPWAVKFTTAPFHPKGSFSKGWREFIAANRFRSGDEMIFTLSGQSCFTVTRRWELMITRITTPWPKTTTLTKVIQQQRYTHIRGIKASTLFQDLALLYPWPTNKRCPPDPGMSHPHWTLENFKRS